MSAVRPNQIVWYWQDGEGRGKKPEPAIVTKVFEDGAVDLWVFCGHGAQRSEGRVAIREEGAVQPIIRYATVKFAKEEAKKPAEAGASKRAGTSFPLAD